MIFLSLSAALLYLAFRKVDLRSVFNQLKSANYSWLIISLTFTIISFFSRARRWVLIIRPLGYNPSLLNTYHAVLTGYLVNFGLPRVGEVTRCVALGRKEKIPSDKLIGTVIAERAFDFLSLIVILLLVLILRNDLMGSFLKNDVILPLKDKAIDLFGYSSLLLIIIGAISVLLVYLTFHFREKLSQNAFFKKIINLLKGILNGLKAFVQIERKIEFIIHTIIIWVCYAMMTWVVVFMIPSTSHLNLADGIFLLVIGSLGMVAPVQGGIGAYHWIVSRALFVVYGISLEDGLVYATLAHESQLILIAILGTFSIFKIFGSNKKSPTDQDTLEDGKK